MSVSQVTTAKTPQASRWTKRGGKPYRVGPKILLPVNVFDNLALAAEAAEGVRARDFGNTSPDRGDPCGCLLGLAFWLGDAAIVNALHVAFHKAALGIPETNDCAFAADEQVLPFAVLCKRAGIDIAPETATA